MVACGIKPAAGGALLDFAHEHEHAHQQRHKAYRTDNERRPEIVGVAYPGVSDRTDVEHQGHQGHARQFRRQSFSHKRGGDYLAGRGYGHGLERFVDQRTGHIVGEVAVERQVGAGLRLGVAFKVFGDNEEAHYLATIHPVEGLVVRIILLVGDLQQFRCSEVAGQAARHRRMVEVDNTHRGLQRQSLVEYRYEE